VVVAEAVAANKTRIGPADALKLLSGIDRLIAARGKTVVEFDLKRDRPDDEALLAHLIGPTGNLRAPAARVGKTLLVGFNPEVYGKVLKV
jgi:arsenate reductase-like glutaredoxin family protein